MTVILVLTVNYHCPYHFKFMLTICFQIIFQFSGHIPSGKHTKNYGQSPFLMRTTHYFYGNFQQRTVMLVRLPSGKLT